MAITVIAAGRVVGVTSVERRNTGLRVRGVATSGAYAAATATTMRCRPQLQLQGRLSRPDHRCRSRSSRRLVRLQQRQLSRLLSPTGFRFGGHWCARALGLARIRLSIESAPHDRHARRYDPHRRFRQPGDPADRAPRARGRGLLRDRPVHRRRGRARAARAQGHHPVGVARRRARGGQPARAAGCCSTAAPDPRHLLRPAGDEPPARRHGRGRRRRRASAAANSAAPSSP